MGVRETATAVVGGDEDDKDEEEEAEAHTDAVGRGGEATPEERCPNGDAHDADEKRHKGDFPAAVGTRGEWEGVTVDEEEKDGDRWAEEEIGDAAAANVEVKSSPWSGAWVNPQRIL